MSATGELRRMLDERGVEYRWDNGTATWYVDGVMYNAWGYDSERLTMSVCHLTPEQAIAATLGGNGKSRWYELFGTPERAARTLGRIGYFKPCDEGQTWDCAQCPFDSFDCGGTGTPIDDDCAALIEWLRGDA